MRLKLVKKIVESEGVISLYFEKPINFKYKSGQYIYLILPKLNYEDSRGNTRQFTIASSPEEEFIQITTKIRESSGYKKTLNEIAINSFLEYDGPFGSFILNKKNRKNIFLAGGIGITPFRSIIKNVTHKKLPIHINLIYSNSGNDFLFKKDIDNLREKNKLLRVHYYDSFKFGRLNKNKLLSLLKKLNFIDYQFWIVGPTPFVNTMEELLINLNIKEEQITTEKFIY